jgi:hypothetical protein
MKTKSILCCLVFAFCTNTCITVYAQSINKQDSLALVDLYNSTNGQNWDYHDNWLTGPVTTWYGIFVVNKRVKEISLGPNNLTGNIPSSLGNLINLTGLYLADNKLSGSIRLHLAI